MNKDEQIRLAASVLNEILSVTLIKNSDYILNAYSQYKEQLKKNFFYSAEYILMDILEYTSNNDIENYCIFLGVAINLYESIHSYKLVEEFQKKYLEECINLYSESSHEAVVAYNNLAEFYYRIAQYEKAEPSYIKALLISKKIFGLYDIKTANLYDNLAALYSDTDRLKVAKSYYKRALVIKKHLFGERHTSVANSMNNLGELYCKTGSYKKARIYLRKALLIFKREYGRNHSSTATVYNNLAALNYSLDKFEIAELFYKQAIKSQEIYLGEFSPTTSNSYNNLALLYINMARYEEAESYLKKVIETNKKVYGIHHINVAVSYNNLANLYVRTCQYEKAEPLIKDSIKIKEEIFCSKENTSIAKAYNSLAVVYKDMGRYNEAEQYYKKSLNIREAVLDNLHPDIVTSYNNLAEFYIKTFRYYDATIFIMKAIELLEQTATPVCSSQITCYINLAEIYRRTKDYSNAEKWYIKSKVLLEKIKGAYSEKAATLYNDLGSLYELKEEYEKAEQFYLESLKIKSNLFGMEHLSIARQYFNLMHLNFQMKRNIEALDYGYTGIVITNKLIQKFSYSMTKESASSFKADTANYYNMYISVIKSIGKVPSKYLFPLIFRKQGEILTSNLRNLLFQKHALPEQINERKKNINKLKLLDGKIASAQATGNLNLVNEKKESRKKIIDEMVKLELEVLPSLSSLTDGEINILDLSEHFLQNELIIEYFKYYNMNNKEYEYCALLASSPNFELKLIYFYKAKVIDTYINNALKLISEVPFNKHENMVTSSILYQLQDAIIKPIESYLYNISSICLCPDSELCKIPFEVLIKDKDIKYMGSIGDIQWLKLLPVIEEKTGHIFSDAAYDAKLTKISMNTIEGYSYNKKGSGLPFKTLLDIEGKLVKELLDNNGYMTTIYSEEEFTKLNLIKVIKPTLLHISTHAFFIEKATDLNIYRNQFDLLLSNFEDAIDRAGLAVSGTNRILKNPESINELIVTARDITNMNLIGTKLVVLSACETGCGEVNIGDGVYGLQRAFFLSGAKTIVMSLWKVSDIVTTLFMQEFYNHILKNVNVYQSLRLAKDYMKNMTKENVNKEIQKLAQKYSDTLHDNMYYFLLSLDKELSKLSASDKPFKDPYYWAGFICMGYGE